MSKYFKAQRPPKGKLVLRKEVTGDEYPIVLQYCIKGKIAKTTFGCNIKENQWDAKKQQIKNHPCATSLNKRLEQFVKEHNYLVLTAFKEKQSLNIKELRFILINRRIPSEKSVCDIGKMLLELKSDGGRIAFSTIINRNNAFEMFDSFIKEEYGEDQFNQILSAEVIERHIAWRKKNRRNGNETINKALQALMMVAEYQYSKNQISLEELNKIKNLFLESEKLSLNAQDLKGLDIPHLKKEDYEKIVNYIEKYEDNQNKRYLDMFHFSMLTGLRWSDILTLEWGHIDWETRMIQKVIVKGKRNFTFKLKLGDEAINILNLQKTINEEKRFVFGLLPNEINLNEDETLYNFRQKYNSDANYTLTKMFKELNLPRLTFHKARHTYAIWALNVENADIKRISSNMGHSSVEVTEKYYAKYIH